MKQLNTISPYEILGLPQDASDADIKAAYKKLAKQHHPDRKGGNAEKMAELNWAYELLCDPDKRAHFDRFGYEEQATQLTEVEQGILAIWGNLIGSANFKPRQDFIADIRMEIKSMIAPLMAEIVKMEAIMPKLRLLQKRIRRKDGKPNTIFHIHLDKTVSATEDHIKENQRKIAVHEKQVKYLDDFEFNWDKPNDYANASSLMFGSLLGHQDFGSYHPPKKSW